MVKIDERYFIDANSNCFELVEIYDDVDKEGNNIKVRNVDGYYGTIEQALNGFVKLKLRTYLSKSDENTVKELKDEIKKLKDFIKNISE